MRRTSLDRCFWHENDDPPGRIELPGCGEPFEDVELTSASPGTDHGRELSTNKRLITSQSRSPIPRAACVGMLRFLKVATEGPAQALQFLADGYALAAGSAMTRVDCEEVRQDGIG